MELIKLIALFVGALIVLLKSSDFFVDKAEKIGLSFGIPPFIIGVTIIAFGTSLPELATGIASTLSNSSEIVGGTVIGSNITNILLVLGITAVVAKRIKITRDIMRLDIPMIVISSFFLMYMLWDGVFSMTDSIIFCVALVIFIISSFDSEEEESGAERPKVKALDYLILVLSAAGVSLGARYVVTAIEGLSALGGVPKDVISLSVVALGTSLPEVVVSVAAVRKGKQEIAVGNVLGSNIFNTFAVVGICRLFGELSFTEELTSFSIPFMVGMTILFAIVCLSKTISRWEGWLFLLLYVFYIITLIPSE